MTPMLRKSALGALAALTLGTAVTAMVPPAAAQGWYGRHGYWHRGYGWRGGYYGGWGAPLAAGVAGGLALGALAGSAYAYAPAYYGRCGWQNQPVYDAWGNFAGYQPRQVCY